jgi:divalent metal cation (Fe/Co/Zn/Cd) transporter
MLRTTTLTALPHGSPEWQRAAHRAKRLSWLSLFYMGAEGALALFAAILASSVALLGFGIDSAVESLASIIVVWRFSGTRTLSETAERRAQTAVAISFFLLAPYIAYEAITKLIVGQHPDTSWVGIALSAVSLVWMPLLGAMKKRLGTQLNSEATAGEGGQNLLCACLAAAVLIGLLGNTLFGWWWLDPVVGLSIAGLAVREGIQALRGDDCC